MLEQGYEGISSERIISPPKDQWGILSVVA